MKGNLFVKILQLVKIFLNILLRVVFKDFIDKVIAGEDFGKKISVNLNMGKIYILICPSL